MYCNSYLRDISIFLSTNVVTCIATCPFGVHVSSQNVSIQKSVQTKRLVDSYATLLQKKTYNKDTKAPAVNKMCSRNPMLRSDLMVHCDICLQLDSAYGILSQLGELGCVQFIDTNADLNAFQKPYILDLCRCAEMERKLHYTEQEMLKEKIIMPGMLRVDEPGPMRPNEMSYYESLLEKWEEDISEMATNQAKLLTNYQQLQEMEYVLKSIGPILGDAEIRRGSIFATSHRAGGDLGAGGHIFPTSGVIKRIKNFAFQKMIWRVSRGNVYFKEAAEDHVFEDIATGNDVRKVAFLVLCQGEELHGRIEKVCHGFQIKLYPCPRTYEERQEMLNKLNLRIDDMEQVLKKTSYHRCKALRSVSREWRKWMIQTKKAKAIFHTLNFFNMELSKNFVIGQCWVPDSDLTVVHAILDKATTEDKTIIPSFMSKSDTKDVYPTYHRTNKFTHGFQALISAYGDSVYREINPGLYAVITFPFLFSVMFGDIGHGLIVVCFALWMVIREKHLTKERSTNEIWNIFFGGRYIMLMMGLFTLFTGFVYNDMFSKPLTLVPSFWRNHFDESIIVNNEFLTLDPAQLNSSKYYFGIDPIWGLSKNKILFDNSIKMKMSIILGVLHMIFGLMVSLFNYLYFKRYYAIFLEFIPQILFLICLFLWLVFLIIFKWLAYSAGDSDIAKRPGCAPLILILFIDMALMRQSKSEDPNCDPYMFPYQEVIQKALVIVSLICVPILLFGKPVYLYLKERNRKKDTKSLGRTSATHAKHEDHSFGELMIHQGVHTIEYVLSTISHTASYLRLWALSLAHAQLSEMLWHMILSQLALKKHNFTGAIMVFVIFAVWAAFSLCILVIMEGLSAFLHTLRLHWVEFMSKFYVGGGVMFYPFSFEALIFSETIEDKATEGICKKRRTNK